MIFRVGFYIQTAINGLNLCDYGCTLIFQENVGYKKKILKLLLTLEHFKPKDTCLIFQHFNRIGFNK